MIKSALNGGIMNLEQLRLKIEGYYENADEIHNIFEELEATYQQLIAMNEQLDHSEKKYATLIKNMSDIVWLTEPDGTITFINEVVEDLLGYKAQEMIGKELNQFMCPLHKYNVGSCKQVVMAMSKIEFLRQEMWMLHKDGFTRKVIEVNTKHFFDGETLIEIQGVGRDITDRIQIQRKINHKNKQLKLVDEISRSMNSNLIKSDLSGLMDEVCKGIVSTMNIPFCSLRILENGQLSLKGVSGKYRERISLQPLQTDDPVINRILTNNQPVILSSMDIGEAQASVKQVFEDSTIKEVLMLPLHTNEQPVGLLSIGHEESYDFDSIAVFTTLANNISNAVEKSRLHLNLKSFYFDLVLTLVAAIEVKDTYTQGHSVRVSNYAVEIGKYLGLASETIDELRIAGILHDVGKLGISDVILSKPGLLTDEEFEHIKTHPQVGLKILGNVNLTDDIKSAILYHHLRYDLKGYPKCDDMTSLPLFARIVGVADALDAMTSHRSYKTLMTFDEVNIELMRCSGNQFCPEVVKATLDLLNSGKIKPLSELGNNAQN